MSVSTLPFSDRLTVALALAALVAVFLIKWVWKSERPPLPPGPKGYPLIGNLFDLPKPTDKPWVYWADYKKLYGPISSIKVFGTTIIIVNDYNLAAALLKKETAADRPNQTFIRSLVGWDDGLPLMAYGDTLKIQRRHIHHTIGTRETVRQYEDTIVKATHKFLYATTRDPNALRKEVRRQANRIILNIAYGYAVDDDEDPLIDAAERVADDVFIAMAPGAFLVDALPFLRHIPAWFPGGGFHRTAKLFRSHLHEFVQVPHEFVKQQIAAGTARPSVVAELISGITSPEGSRQQLVDDFNIKWASSMIFLGGHDTTVSAAHSFFLAMLLNPQVQRRAQEEVDRVLGPGLARLPTSADRARMPYVNTVMIELWRRYSPFQMSIPHAATEDIEFEGYLLPKGSVIFPNNWAFNHDPEIFPDPMAFRPERHLNKSEKSAPFSPTDLAFGYGRRACAGRELAELEAWYFATMTLATLDIKPALDSNGKEIIPAEHYTNFSISHPHDFKCMITPRSEQAAAFIRLANAEPPESDAETLRHVKWRYRDVNGNEN